MAVRTARQDPSIRLDVLTVALQPVVNLRTGDVFGFEALLRGPHGVGVDPPALFRRAHREGWAETLEYRAQQLAVNAAKRHLRGKEILFLNLDTQYAVDVDYYPHLVLEINEGRNVDRRAIERLQREGHALYLDDYGVSHGNISRLLEMEPAGIKVDRSIVQGIATDPRRYAVACALANVADDLGITVVAEGIETHDDLCAIRRAGFGYGQGYYLGRPVLVPDRLHLAQFGKMLRDLPPASPSNRKDTARLAF